MIPLHPPFPPPDWFEELEDGLIHVSESQSEEEAYGSVKEMLARLGDPFTRIVTPPVRKGGTGWGMRGWETGTQSRMGKGRGEGLERDRERTGEEQGKERGGRGRVEKEGGGRGRVEDEGGGRGRVEDEGRERGGKREDRELGGRVGIRER